MSGISIDYDSNRYKQTRLEEEITWYSKKARDNKLRFRLCQVIILIAGTIIPVINLVGIGDVTRITSSIIGATIAIATGIAQLEKYQENWILYRRPPQNYLKKRSIFLKIVQVNILS